MKLKSRYWWDLSTRDFAALDMEKIVAVQPVGAVEQHGPHLPVRVDAAINEGIVARALALMPDDLPVLVLPALPVGKSNEHIAYPGTLSLSYETLARVWTEIGESVHRAGCRRLVFFNSHGGQPQVMDIVCRELRVRLAMLAVGCSWFRTVDTADLFDLEERRHGIHAGASETSVMLHLHPGLVDMTLAENFVPLSVTMEREGQMLSPEGTVGFGWQMQDLHPAGAAGNAAAADAAKGRELTERAASALVRLLQEVARFPLAALSAHTAFGEYSAFR
jgi:creatinine amidohydrolase